MQQEQLKKLKRSRNKNPPYKSSLSLLIQGVIEASYMVLSTFQENPCSVLIVLSFNFHNIRIKFEENTFSFISTPCLKEEMDGGDKKGIESTSYGSKVVCKFRLRWSSMIKFTNTIVSLSQKFRYCRWLGMYNMLTQPF